MEIEATLGDWGLGRGAIAMPMAAVAAAMPSCCVKSAVAGAAAGQWVERSGGRVARGGLRSSMWQMGGCYWPSEQLRCAWRAPPGRLAVVSCTTSSTTTSTTTTGTCRFSIEFQSATATKFWNFHVRVIELQGFPNM